MRVGNTTSFFFSLLSVLGPGARRRLGPPGGDVALPDLSRPLVAEVLHERLEHEDAPRVQLQRSQSAVAETMLCRRAIMGGLEAGASPAEGTGYGRMGGGVPFTKKECMAE